MEISPVALSVAAVSCLWGAQLKSLTRLVALTALTLMSIRAAFFNASISLTLQGMSRAHPRDLMVPMRSRRSRSLSGLVNVVARLATVLTMLPTVSITGVLSEIMVRICAVCTLMLSV
ncbi:hypothetical protein D3C77_491720 [compost metagenome]